MHFNVNLNEIETVRFPSRIQHLTKSVLSFNQNTAKQTIYIEGSQPGLN
jgi:hypothetical protein